MILLTGAAGFIGSNFALGWFQHSTEPIVSLDKLTYAGNINNLSSLQGEDRHFFVQGSIGDRILLKQILSKHQPRAVINFAAESHVDRSINKPEAFIQTNIIDTFNLLDVAHSYWVSLSKSDKSVFRFLHISTDEVYGSLSKDEPPFTECSRYKPNSPYSASKAASDHLVRAWHHTYGLPTLTTNCSNNYGPYQLPEKFIPLVIVNALAGKYLPVYGDGMQVRDWLYVQDHCSAICRVLQEGIPGEVYNIGGCNEYANIDVVNIVCNLLDELHPRADKLSYSNQIKFVDDRLGHDRRYAINASKIVHELRWVPSETFESGIRKTICWYLNNLEWVQSVQNNEYCDWANQQYVTI